MKTTLKVVIVDIDKLFVYGLKSILHEHFLKWDVKLVYLTANKSHIADIVFKPSAGYLSLKKSIVRGPRKIDFSITLSARYFETSIVENSRTKGSIYSNATVEVINKILQGTSCFYHKDNKHNIDQPHLDISKRERQILFGFSLDMSPEKIAKHCRISEKTVSTHKRNAMKKLGFSNYIDMYKWLNDGGLAN